MSELLIRGGRVLDPRSGRDGVADVLIDGATIKSIGTARATSNGATVIDATGQLVVPGLVDVHVHLRQPGKEEAETIASGCHAAAAGGFTTICPMPNTTPAIDTPGLVEFVLAEAAKAAHPISVKPIAAITRQREGKELTDFRDLAEAGAVAFSDDGSPVADSYLMRKALEYAAWLKRPVVSHAEDPALAHGGVMHEGFVATVLGLQGMPASAETVMVARDLELAATTGGHVHIAHVSTAGSVALIQAAKRRGIRVSCETCPHYVSLTDEAVRGYRTEAKMNPPLRTDADRQAIIEGLCDGTIDAIATDHAPHAAWEKAAEFDQAPFGVVGLETALGVIATSLIATGKISWLRAIDLMSAKPAELFHLDGGALAEGGPADVTIVDSEATWTVDPEQFASKSRNSPFIGQHLQGRVVATIARGRVIYNSNGVK